MEKASPMVIQKALITTEEVNDTLVPFKWYLSPRERVA